MYHQKGWSRIFKSTLKFSKSWHFYLDLDSEKLVLNMNDRRFLLPRFGKGKSGRTTQTARRWCAESCVIMQQRIVWFDDLADLRTNYSTQMETISLRSDYKYPSGEGAGCSALVSREEVYRHVLCAIVHKAYEGIIPFDLSSCRTNKVV